MVPGEIVCLCKVLVQSTNAKHKRKVLVQSTKCSCKTLVLPNRQRVPKALHLQLAMVLRARRSRSDLQERGRGELFQDTSW